MNIIFLGSGEFAALVLHKLIKSKFKPIAVITRPDKPKGRKKVLMPPPVKIVAEQYDLTFFQPEKISDFKFEIEKMKPDLIIVTDYGHIIPKEVLDIPKFGSINLHPSLLPKYRGPSPIQYTILNGDSETGVTIILMDEKIDHGPIIKNSKIKIQNSKVTYSKLLIDLANLGGDLLLETLPQWLEGKIKPLPQNDAQATYTKILTRRDGKIDWTKSAEEIERQIRGFEKWPESWCEWQKNDKKYRLKVFKARVLHPFIGCGENSAAGFVFKTTKNELAVNCRRGSLVIEELQLESKKKMKSSEFLLGYPEIVKSILK